MPVTIMFQTRMLIRKKKCFATCSNDQVSINERSIVATTGYLIVDHGHNSSRLSCRHFLRQLTVHLHSTSRIFGQLSINRPSPLIDKENWMYSHHVVEGQAKSPTKICNLVMAPSLPSPNSSAICGTRVIPEDSAGFYVVNILIIMMWLNFKNWEKKCLLPSERRLDLAVSEYIDTTNSIGENMRGYTFAFPD